jgi:hypothetical protein
MILGSYLVLKEMPNVTYLSGIRMLYAIPGFSSGKFPCGLSNDFIPDSSELFGQFFLTRSSSALPLRVRTISSPETSIFSYWDRIAGCRS